MISLLGILKRMMNSIEVHFNNGRLTACLHEDGNGVLAWRECVGSDRSADARRASHYLLEYCWKTWDYHRSACSNTKSKGLLTSAWLIAHSQNLETDPIHEMDQRKIISGNDTGRANHCRCSHSSGSTQNYVSEWRYERGIITVGDIKKWTH